MAPKLTDEQRQAIEHQPGSPVYVDDAVNHVKYVLIPAEVFQRVQSLFTADSLDIADTYAAQSQALAESWSLPAMDAYQDDSRRSV